MEGLTRLVTESLARHGFDRPLDYRRLRWSRWFRCDSPHSLLSVPSKPGIFAVAEEIMNVGTDTPVNVGADAFVLPPGRGPASLSARPQIETIKRMLAVTQFFEDDDMAFVLDRMLSRQNPMQARLASGRYFVRFVVIEDQAQRRSICTALNQWMISAAEKATGIGSDFASSLELTPATEYIPDQARGAAESVRPELSRRVRPPSLDPASCPATPQLDSGAATNIHCPSPFPSGF